MLRIEANRGADELTVTASGELTAEHLPELDRVIREATATGLPVALDLAAVTFADRDSIVFLAGKRARILRAPAFMQEWIRLEILREKGETTVTTRSLIAALVLVVSVAGFGCEHLRSKDLGKEEPVAAEKVAKAAAPLNPYEKN